VAEVNQYIEAIRVADSADDSAT